jgi:hypothetical protein
VPVDGLQVGDVEATQIRALSEEDGFAAGGEAGFGPGEFRRGW